MGTVSRKVVLTTKPIAMNVALLLEPTTGKVCGMKMEGQRAICREVADQVGKAGMDGHGNRQSGDLYFASMARGIIPETDELVAEIVFFRGPLEFAMQCALAAELQISSLVEAHHIIKERTQIVIPDCIVKRLIGKAGAGIRAIERKVPECTIIIQSMEEQMTSPTGAFGRQISIYGPITERLLAVRNIETFISSFKEYPTSWRGSGVLVPFSPENTSYDPQTVYSDVHHRTDPKPVYARPRSNAMDPLVRNCLQPNYARPRSNAMVPVTSSYLAATSQNSTLLMQQVPSLDIAIDRRMLHANGVDLRGDVLCTGFLEFVMQQSGAMIYVTFDEIEGNDIIRLMGPLYLQHYALAMVQQRIYDLIMNARSACTVYFDREGEDDVRCSSPLEVSGVVDFIEPSKSSDDDAPVAKRS